MSIAIEQLLQGLTQEILQEQQQQAQQATLDTTLRAVNGALTQINAIITLLTNGTYGLAALNTQIATFEDLMSLDVTAILTAIGAPQQVGSPVTLPGAIPGGWNLPTNDSVGASVWGFVTGPLEIPVADQLTKICYLARNIDVGGSVAIPGSPYFVLTGWANSDLGNFNPAYAPQPDVGAILPTDTLTTWLTRELPGWTIYPGYWGGTEIAVYGGSVSSLTYTCTLDDDTFAVLQGSRVAPAGLPPIWPGLAGVTIGASVPLADGLVVTGPVQGVIVTITSVPRPISYYPFGTIKSYVRAGAVIFSDDNGQSEFPQPLGPDSQILLPLHMTGAALVTFRVPSGVVGTVEPFTIP